MLSSVSGLPLGRYVRIVMPWCVKAGFITAASAMTGSSQRSFCHSASHPCRRRRYHDAHSSEIARHTGCIRLIESTSTSA